MQRHRRHVMLFRALAALAGTVLAGAVQAEAPVKLARVWSVAVEPGAGFAHEYLRRIAVHADGTTLVAMSEERPAGNTGERRLVILAIGDKGQGLGRVTLPPGNRTYTYIGAAALTATADGFALASVTEPGRAAVHRFGRDGVLRSSHAIRLGRESFAELGGIAADGRGNLLVYGGVAEGPHAPALAGIDRAGRVAWFFAGRNPMPPGGVPAARFRSDGGTDAVVIDREKPSWERRTAAGKLVSRAALADGQYCWQFLDDRRLAHLFVDYETQPDAKTESQRWILGFHAADGSLVPGAITPALAPDKHGFCTLATNPAGWIAASLSGSKILVYDAALAPRGEIDLAEAKAESIQALTIDAKGSVTALIAIQTPVGTAQAFMVVRFAPVAR